MPVVIAPDPTTRECREHPGYYMTDTRECFRCELKRAVQEMRDALADHLRRPA